jgi:hypothetical protein
VKEKMVDMMKSLENLFNPKEENNVKKTRTNSKAK